MASRKMLRIGYQVFGDGKDCGGKKSEGVQWKERLKTLLNDGMEGCACWTKPYCDM